MTHSRGPDPAPRAGRALPAKWHLAAAAAGAFLLYALFAPVADWLGLRGRPEPEPASLKGEAAVEGMGAVEAKLVAALRELAAGTDDAKRDQAEKLLQDYLRVRMAAESEIRKTEESEIAKQERKRKEDEAYSRAWSRFSEMLDDRRVNNRAIVDHLVKNLTVLPGHAVETAVRRFIDRTRVQSGAEREMALLARELEGLIVELPRVSAAGGGHYQAQVRIRERIEGYHAARRKAGLPEDRSGERELRAVVLMPFESGARVLLRNLTKSSSGAMVSAMYELRLDWLIGRAGAPLADGPLFPEPPRIPERKFAGPDREKNALLSRKWDLAMAIETVYQDCREPYRERYVGLLKQLVAQYMAMGRVVESVPVTKYYPDFLLSEAATPNERLLGAGAILFEGVFTRSAEAKLAALPEALIGKQCPAERLAYAGPKGSQFPRTETLGIWEKDEFRALPAERVPFEAARALDLALQHCEPRTRDAYADHIMRFVGRAMAVKRRRAAAPGDEAVAAQLRSANRKEMAAGLKRAILLPDITEDLARAAQAAANRLFEEQCPASAYPTQLEAYRGAEAKRAAELEAERAARKK